MTQIIEIEENLENIVIDCFKEIGTVYFDIKNDLESDKKLNISESGLFLYKKSLNEENDIRDLIFMKLHNSGFSKYKKEKNNKDLTYQTNLKPGFTFIIEAKRLDGENKLNNEYIKSGVNRFKNKDGVTDYSKDIKKNENIAGMLGFIIKDGKINLIITDIKQKIIENDEKDEILENQYIITKENSFISKNGYFENNKRTSNSFTLYHYFLDFSSIGI